MKTLLLAPAAAIAACGTPPATPEATSSAVAMVATPVAGVPAAGASSPAAAPAPRFIAADLVRQQWTKASNRAHCAPIAFTDDGRAGGKARPATFSGGWAVAFDLAGMRSAYGVAGPGLIEADRGPPYAQSRRLTRQWPYVMQLDQFDRPSFAGYGLEGAKPYRAANPSGDNENALAYVRIHRQQCTYNVWSRLGRAHLERLLRGLAMLPGANPADKRA